jgi:membrane protease YdiL (CAAX protease family)
VMTGTTRAFPLGRTITLLFGTAVATMVAAVLVVACAIFSGAVAAQAFFADPVPLAVMAQGISYVPCFFTMWRFGPWATGVDWARIGLRRPGWNDISLGAIGAVVAFVTASVVEIILIKTTGAKVNNGEFLLGHHPDATQFIILIVVAIVGAPLTEEMAFRGVMLNALLARWGAPVAVGGSALAFAMMHLSIINFIPLVCVGVIFALCYRWTGNLWTSITAHALFNMVGAGQLLTGHR